MTIRNKFLCLIGDHEWTCKASEGIKPSEDEEPKSTDSPEETIRKFMSFAKMYCKRCPKVSQLTI